MAASLVVRGRGEVELKTDPEQIVLIVENLTTGQVDLHIDWSITNNLKVSGNGSCEAYVAYGLGIGEVGNSYHSEKHCNGSINTSGLPNGSQVIGLSPGKHCLFLSVDVEAVAEVTWDDDESPTTSEAGISGIVNISVQ